MGRRRTTKFRNPVKEPQNWDVACNAAFLRCIGLSQKRAAEQAGVSERTLVDWEACQWWADAVSEARGRWLIKTEMDTMAAITADLKSPMHRGPASRYMGDRIIPELKPPTVKTELSGNKDAPVHVWVVGGKKITF